MLPQISKRPLSVWFPVSSRRHAHHTEPQAHPGARCCVARQRAPRSRGGQECFSFQQGVNTVCVGGSCRADLPAPQMRCCHTLLRRCCVWTTGPQNALHPLTQLCDNLVLRCAVFCWTGQLPLTGERARCCSTVRKPLERCRACAWERKPQAEKNFEMFLLAVSVHSARCVEHRVRSTGRWHPCWRPYQRGPPFVVCA